MACYKSALIDLEPLITKRATRGKCLIVFKSVVPTVKFFKLIHQTQSLVNKIFGYALNSLFSRLILGTEVCFSHFKKYFNLLFFDNNIRKYEFAKMSQSLTSAFPAIDWTFAIYGALFGRIFAFPTTKDFKEPIRKAFIGCSDSHNGLKEPRSSDFVFVPIISDEERSFSINNASKVCQMSICMNRSCIFAFRHLNSFVRCVSNSTGSTIKCTA